MIDSHCHLTDPRLADQLPEVFRRATLAGVERLVTIGTDPHNAAASICLCQRYWNLRCAIGVHPNEVERVESDSVSRIRDMAADPTVAAIGEIGLDYHYNVDRQKQKAMFIALLKLAVEIKKPVVIHSRESVDDTLEILKDFSGVRAVFHCFTGSAKHAEAIISAGFWLGFTGPVTYKKNDELREVVRFTPADRMMLETDAPYLSPEPVRTRKVCEPAFVAHTLEQVARIKGWTNAEADEIISHNTRLFYNWPPDDSAGFVPASG